MDNFDEVDDDEYWSDTTIICPHCKETQWDVDSAVSDMPESEECNDCKETFEYWAEVEVTYHSAKKGAR